MTTKTAEVGSFPRMNPQVFLQVITPTCPILTVWTHKEGTFCMLLQMLTELRPACRGEGAEYTPVGGNYGVHGGCSLTAAPTRR